MGCSTLRSLRKTTLDNNNTPEHDHHHDHAPHPHPPPPARPSRPPLRPPLRPRHPNAMLRHPPLTAKTGNAANNMPAYEKQNRPVMPSLGAAPAAKSSSKPPLTPRVAAPASHAALTPLLPRRGAHVDHHTPPVASSREDLASPISAFLNNNNITPRSGSRKSRVGSTHTTPAGTPNGTPAPPTNEFPSATGDTPRVTNGLDTDLPKRTTVSFSPAASEIGVAKSPTAIADSKFFHASDAKSVQAPPRPPPQTKNPSTFFYANGDLIQRPESPTTLALGSSLGEERSQPKFFHVNGTPDLQPSPQFPPHKPSSTISTSSRMTSPRLAQGATGLLPPTQRPPSPQKPSISSFKNAPLHSPVVTRPQPQGRGQSASNIVATRKESLVNVQRAVSHGRSASMDSPDSKAGRRISGGSSIESTAPPPPSTPLNTISTILPISSPEGRSNRPQPTEEVPSASQSPIKTGHSLEHLNELAANARQERKVLDLEITNSSLAAINRTLEREMRKQTAELRRYRRLSRSGRISINTSASIRSASGTLSIMDGVAASPLSDMSEEDSDQDSDLDSSETDSVDDGSLSPGAMAESDLRHRKKDEKRLQLDLSKHQQLLIDSQRMNQSLKRCLGWTEELIKEGKKALEYRVRVSDIELGGRVLAPDEVEGEEGEALGEGDLGEMGKKMLEEARLAAANGVAWSANRDLGDRDSGIEIAEGQREHLEGPPEMTPHTSFPDGSCSIGNGG